MSDEREVRSIFERLNADGSSTRVARPVNMRYESPSSVDVYLAQVSNEGQDGDWSWWASLPAYIPATKLNETWRGMTRKRGDIFVRKFEDKFETYVVPEEGLFVGDVLAFNPSLTVDMADKWLHDDRSTLLYFSRNPMVPFRLFDGEAPGFDHAQRFLSGTMRWGVVCLRESLVKYMAQRGTDLPTACQKLCEAVSDDNEGGASLRTALLAFGGGSDIWVLVAALHNRAAYQYIDMPQDRAERFQRIVSIVRSTAMLVNALQAHLGSEPTDLACQLFVEG